MWWTCQFSRHDNLQLLGLNIVRVTATQALIIAVVQMVSSMWWVSQMSGPAGLKRANRDSVVKQCRCQSLQCVASRKAPVLCKFALKCSPPPERPWILQPAVPSTSSAQTLWRFVTQTAGHPWWPSAQHEQRGVSGLPGTKWERRAIHEAVQILRTARRQAWQNSRCCSKHRPPAQQNLPVWTSKSRPPSPSLASIWHRRPLA